MQSPEHDWQPMLPEDRPLAASEIQLWLIDLDPLPDRKPDPPQQPLLSPDEWRRADQISEPLPRWRFIRARSQLRRLLGCALARPPLQLEFVYGSSGKPALPGGECAFNLSHAGGRALLALSRTCPVGVDLEYLANANNRPLVALLRRVAGNRAAEELERLDRPSERRELFLRRWTEHEALAKLAGVSLFNRQQVDGIRQQATLVPLKPGRDWVAALATLKDSFTLRTYYLRQDP